MEKIIKEIEDLSGEYAWIHNQGEQGKEKYDISKNSFIDGAKTVIDLLNKRTDVKEEKIEIGYDITATDAYFIVTGLLDRLGIEYEESGEETITIKYKINNG